MKMTMIKYLFPILLALAIPATAQSPLGDCTTPAQVEAFAASTGFSLIVSKKDFTDYAGHWDEFRAYTNDGETVLLWFRDGCVADENNLPADKAEDYLNSIGINKAGR